MNLDIFLIYKKLEEEKNEKKEINIFGWSLLAACFITIPFLGILFNVAMLIYALIEYNENKKQIKIYKSSNNNEFNCNCNKYISYIINDWAL